MSNYFGSKATSGLCQPIIAMMPPHTTYIETHLGGGAIMKRKPPALNNIGIDIDPRPLSKFECSYPVDLVNGCAHQFDMGKGMLDVLIRCGRCNVLGLQYPLHSNQLRLPRVSPCLEKKSSDINFAPSAVYLKPWSANPAPASRMCPRRLCTPGQR